MRTRYIKPSYFDNEVMAMLSDKSQKLYLGLLCLADREGKLEDRPMRIKAKIFPYQIVETEDLLNELNESGFIIRYIVNRKQYIMIYNFAKHQNPHPGEALSEFPYPEGFTPPELSETSKKKYRTETSSKVKALYEQIATAKTIDAAMRRKQ